MRAFLRSIKPAWNAVTRPLRDSRGATAVEYGLILAMIVLAMFVALKNVANVTIAMWGNVSDKVSNAR